MSTYHDTIDIYSLKPIFPPIKYECFDHYINVYHLYSKTYHIFVTTGQLLLIKSTIVKIRIKCVIRCVYIIISS